MRTHDTHSILPDMSDPPLVMFTVASDEWCVICPSTAKRSCCCCTFINSTARSLPVHAESKLRAFLSSPLPMDSTRQVCVCSLPHWCVKPAAQEGLESLQAWDCRSLRAPF